MPYFPTNAAWTHAILPTKPRSPTRSRSSTPSNPSRPAKLNRTFRQSTLAFPAYHAPSNPLPSAEEIMHELYPPTDFNSPSSPSSSSSTPSSNAPTPPPASNAPSSPNHE
ncbi:hypothetical protein P692DRAFT_201779529 [Suillus brevipes Sb2]|nr:hypothetical protein P692DRAFT_201779529 [Suillus brevipes Sb2]